MTRSRLLSLAALALFAAAASFALPALAGDGGPAAVAAAEPTTPTPLHTMLMWVGKQVSPDSCACPTDAKNDAAWRAWFAGGNDVALVGLRDALVQGGWDADRTVAFFQSLRPTKCGGDRAGCDGTDCANCPGNCAGNCRGAAREATGAAAPTAAATGEGAGSDCESGCGGDAPCCRCAKARAESATTNVPTAAVRTEPAASAPTGEATAREPKSPSPVHAMMIWVAGQVMPEHCACPSTPAGAAAWRTWFAGGSDVPLAGLRQALLDTGWDADRTIGYFEKMAAHKASCGDKSSCSGNCGGSATSGERRDCAGCPSAR
jgi:hypothetical protein